MENWAEIDELAGVDLEDSWILGWHYDSEQQHLGIELEASLWPGNPHYENPKPDEYTCYKKAVLTFEGVEDLKGLPKQEEVRPNHDPDGSVDFGNIYGFRFGEDGAFSFETDFGEISGKCRSFRFAVNEAA